MRKHLPLALAGATLERRELPLQLRLLDILLDPNLITLLFLGGILGIAFELTHPGIVLPGLLGTVALLLALLGLSIVPFSWAGIGLLAFGIALLALEGHTPAHGAFAAVGTLSLVLGGVLLFRVDNSPYGMASLWLVLAIALSLGLIMMFLIDALWRARRLPARGAGVVARRPAGNRRDGPAPERPGTRPRRALAGPARGRRSRRAGESVRVTGQQGLLLEVEREAGDGPERA